MITEILLDENVQVNFRMWIVQATHLFHTASEMRDSKSSNQIEYKIE